MSSSPRVTLVCGASLVVAVVVAAVAVVAVVAVGAIVIVFIVERCTQPQCFVNILGEHSVLCVFG